MIKKWEYMIFEQTTLEHGLKQAEEMLDIFGNKGWELCTSLDGRLYFKREIDQLMED